MSDGDVVDAALWFTGTAKLTFSGSLDCSLFAGCGFEKNAYLFSTTCYYLFTMISLTR